MKARFTYLALCGLGLVACEPVNIYYKPGAKVTTMQSDTQTCRINALRSAPVNKQVRRTPPRYVPLRKICDKSRQVCSQTGGYYLPGETYVFDANEKLRGELENQCMAKRGYLPISIPECPKRIVEAAKPGRTKRLPRLSDKSCAIRNKDGSFQIVNQG